MKVEKEDIRDDILTVILTADKSEFDNARIQAYKDNTDHYPVPGVAGGEASLEQLSMIYGPAVLYDEALAVLVPALFNRFLNERKIRIMGRPKLSDLRFLDGGVSFQIEADMYPEVELGIYRGVRVPFRRDGEQDRFEQAALMAAGRNMKGEVPPHMAEQKLNSIIAREKINISNEAIYHLLADAEIILRKAYEEAGAARPKVQVRREAMDLMLQTVSEEHQNDWKDFFHEQIMVMAERYHSLDEDYSDKLQDIIDNRMKEKNEMDKEELIDQIFDAYLGSLELSRDQWREQRKEQAQREARIDLLLDAVSRQESLSVDPAELHRAIEDIAASCNMSPEEAESKMDLDPLYGKLLRDKALKLILDNAVTDEELRLQYLKEKEKQEQAMS